MSLKEQASRAISLLTLYEIEGNSIERIISVVQGNHEYFGARPGDSTLEAAAKKLEQLVAEAAEHSVQRTGLTCPSCKSDNCFEAVICVNCGAHSAPRR